MLYDEEGRPYIEPPLLPDDERIRYIVKDYGRMYKAFGNMEQHIKRLQESLEMVNSHLFATRRITHEKDEVISHCLKLLKKYGIQFTPFLKQYINHVKRTKGVKL